MYIGPLLAILVVALMEGLYDLGIPVISPGVVLLLPIVYTAAFSGWRTTAVTGILSIAYLLRHYHLNRSEYISNAAGISFDDVSRILIFGAAAVGLVTIAMYRERQRQVQRSLQSAYSGAIEADRAKSQFLAVVSHELRTPLTTIIQYTDLLSAGVGGEVNRDQREMLQRIESGALHLRAMIQRLLDYAQMERGDGEPRRETVDLVLLVRETVKLLDTAAAGKGLELRLNLPADPVVTVTDPDRYRQIVLNLVDNAIKFTDHGSVTVSLHHEPNASSLRVADTGPGIPASARSRVWEPFWQGEDAMTRRRGGLGLGLAITFEQVTALGGEIVLESTPGDGSAFTVMLPQDPSMQQPSAEGVAQAG